VVIVYHTPWPGPQDPLYLHNPADAMARTELFMIPYVPFIFVDGWTYLPECYFYHMYQTAYDQRKATPTDVTLTATGSYGTASRNLNFTLTASTTSELPEGDYRLQVVLTESHIEWEAPNGETIHDWIMRKMYPDAEGTAVTFSGSMPQLAQTTVSAVLDTLYAPENCDIVYFLQDMDTRETLQSGTVALMDLVTPSGVPQLAATGFELEPNYPNPFNPTTTIPVQVSRSGELQLAIYSADGRRVRTLHRGSLAEGRHEFQFDGRDDQGMSLPSGVYMARAQGGHNESATSRRLVLVK